MVRNTVSQELVRGQATQERDRAWEEDCYRRGCALAQQEAGRRLQALEQRLHAQRPASWQTKGWRERTLVTRFGAVRLRRRLYQDEAGTYHFLLDEHLGWLPAQVATPHLTTQVVQLASRLPFREVRRTLAELTAGALAPATIHRLVGHVSQRAQAAEKRAWQACFEQG